MKKLFILILLPLASFAQQPWQQYEIDSADFVEVFGTVDQYQFQKSIERKSDHKTLCLWIGAKAQWMYNFAMYLDLTTKYDVVWNDESDTEIVIEATHKISTTAVPPVIVVKALYDDEGKTQRVTITGPADDLIDIFIDYWQLSELSVNELKTKEAVIKYFVSDKISFTWPGTDPVITVTKNELAGVDMFKLK